MLTKKVISVLSATVLTCSILSGCGGTTSSDAHSVAAGNTEASTSSAAATASASKETKAATGGKITIYQNKTEIYDKLVEMAAEYQKETGVEVEIWQISGDDYYQDLKTYMSSESGPTIFTIESQTEIDEMKNYMEDLSDLSFMDKESDDLLAKNDDGKTIGIPTTAEGFGLVYNKDLVDPDKINSIDDLNKFIEDEKASGIDGVGLSQEDYFLIGHILNTPFALQDDPAGFCSDVYSGKKDIASTDQFKQLGSLFDTIRSNEQNPLELTYDKNVGNFATGKTAMIHQGNWCYSMFKDYNVDFDMGMMGLPIDGNKKISVGVPAYWAINTDATDEEKQLGKDFLNWLYTSDKGTDYLLNQFGFIPVVEGMTSDKLDPLSQAVSDAIASDNIIPWTFNESWPAGIVTTYLAPNAQEFFSDDSVTSDDFLKKINDSFVQAAAE